MANSNGHCHRTPLDDNIGQLESVVVVVFRVWGNGNYGREFWPIANESIYRIGHSSGG